MPQSLGKRTYSKFVRGLITEASELNFPLDASVDEDNCVLLRDATRRRRLGVDREVSNNSSDQIQENRFSDGAISFYKWTEVAGAANRVFGVLQLGNKLFFNDLAADPITFLDIQVDLSAHTFPGAQDVGQQRCEMVGAKGSLFVVSKGIVPIIITYDSAAQTISIIESVLKVRDFEGVTDDLEFDEEPATLTPRHEYNLRNQGWNPPGDGKFEPITVFQKAKGRFPGNNKQWHAGKLSATSADEATITAQGSTLNSVIAHLVTIGSITSADVVTSLDGTFDPNLLDNLASGLTQAPKGHYLISPMERTLKERERLSEIANLDDILAGQLITGLAPAAEESVNSTTKVLSHANALDGGAGDIHDEDAEHHTISFIGTEAGLGPSCSIDTTIKKFGAGSVQKLRGAPGGESGLNIIRNSDNEWTELFNDQDCQLSMFMRLRNFTTTESTGIISMFSRWTESLNFRSWALEWWPASHSVTPGARDQGSSGNAGFVFETSAQGTAGAEHRILPSFFPYQFRTGVQTFVCFSWKQSTRTLQIFVKEDFEPTKLIGEAVVDAASFPFQENTDNLFCGKRNSVGSQGSWDGWIDEIHVQEQRTIFAATVDPVPPVAPSAIEFFAGRICYGGGGENGLSGRIIMSPVLERLTQAGDCFQAGDPTAEKVSELVDSDGTDIVIDNMGETRKLYAIGPVLLVLATNGVWTISGIDNTGFKASGFEIKKLSSSGILSPAAFVDGEGTPFWWAESGIFSIRPNKDSGQALISNLSLETMQGFYDGNDDFDGIPNWSKEYASGSWDDEGKRALWLYRATDPGDNTYRHKYDRALVFDPKLDAFYPWSFSPLASDTPYIVAAFSTEGKGDVFGEVDVAVENELVLDNSAVQVVVNREILTARDILLKLVVIEPATGGATSLYTFGQLNNATFFDWVGTDATGVAFTSFAQAGHELGDDAGQIKWAPRLISYLRRGTNHDLTMQARWEWADAAASGKFSTAQSVYSNVKNPDTDGTAGFPVIVSSKKIRGRGHALSVRYTSVAGKDFELIGWTTEFLSNQRIV